jgi:hypothetical protein
MSSEKTVFESWMDRIGTDPNGFLSSMVTGTKNTFVSKETNVAMRSITKTRKKKNAVKKKN